MDEKVYDAPRRQNGWRIKAVQTMAKLQYKSLDEINGSPQSLLQFAQELKTIYEARQPSGQSLHDFMQKEVSAGGKPLSASRQLMHLEQGDFDLDNFDVKDMTRLAEASKILEGMEPSWKIREWMPDRRITQKLDELNALQSTKDLAERACVTFGAKPEHTIKACLRL